MRERTMEGYILISTTGEKHDPKRASLEVSPILCLYYLQYTSIVSISNMHGYNNPYMVFDYKCLCGPESLLHYHSTKIALYYSSVWIYAAMLWRPMH